MIGILTKICSNLRPSAVSSNQNGNWRKSSSFIKSQDAQRSHSDQRDQQNQQRPQAAAPPAAQVERAPGAADTMSKDMGKAGEADVHLPSP
jgi:hypothetical protein